ncbi:hypothetical protein [Helicovermis profundi]|uniref:Protein arginine kinase n=1 Tax=Helicovermis profundi TaxID=3065157 RepID=A0AAU9E9K3_9FIRM|nr:protein arginine kinase [Clostridia bacterium S502]
MNDYKIRKISKEYLTDNLIIFSQAKYIRNIDEFPFVIALNEKNAKESFSKIYKGIYESELINDFELVAIREKKKIDRCLDVFMEKTYVANNVNIARGIYINEQKRVAIFVNFKDHIKIMSSALGNKLDECYSIIDKIDDKISEQIKYAYDGKYGFLTSSLMDVGTGFRSNLVFHLPALSIIGYIDKLRDALIQIGYNFENILKENDISESHYYMLSNKFTLGVSEKEIVELLKDLSREIISKEVAARETLINSRIRVLENDIKRAYGLLKHATLIKYEEAIKYISLIKLGISYGFFNDVDENYLDKVVFEISDNYLLEPEKKVISKNDIEYTRSKKIKKCFIGD